MYTNDEVRMQIRKHLPGEYYTSPGARISYSQILQQSDILGEIMSFIFLNREMRVKLMLISRDFFSAYVLPNSHYYQQLIRKSPDDGNKMIRSYILRDSDKQKLAMFDERRSMFVMYARRCSKLVGLGYVISVVENGINKDYHVGTLKSNFLGTMHKIMEGNDQKGFIKYKPMVFCDNGPRRITVAIPKFSCPSDYDTGYWMDNPATPLMDSFPLTENNDLIQVLKNKTPRYCSKTRKYTLEFCYGRVKKPSVKNMIICDPENPAKVLLQFGKVSDNRFNLDYRSPLSAFQAFSIALSTFDWKPACN
jgi:hypothetical protein